MRYWRFNYADLDEKITLKDSTLHDKKNLLRSFRISRNLIVSISKLQTRLWSQIKLYKTLYPLYQVQLWNRKIHRCCGGDQGKVGRPYCVIEKKDYFYDILQGWD